MDGEYKNKMARSPGIGSRLGEVPGSGTRAPSLRPTPPPLAGQSSERNASGCTKSAPWETGWKGQGRGGREKVRRNQRPRGQKEARETA